MRHSQRICLFCIRANRHLCLVNLVLCRSVPCIDQDFVLVRAVYEQAPKILGIHLAAAQGIEDKTGEELFLGFYRERRDGMEPDGPERALLRFAADQVRRMNRDEDKLEWERQSAALLKFALGQEDEE